MADPKPHDNLRPSLSAPEPDTQPSHPHGISINLPTGPHDARPPAVTHISTPAYKSPLRHHKRAPSRSKGVKETLDAHSHYGSTDDGDGPAVHRINQYIIKQEIGRGSFGSVHLAEDQFGNEYAVKEFSKSRLRKRAQSNLLRKPNQTRRGGHIAAGLGFNSPLHRLSSSNAKAPEANNSLNLIKEEIAIMKKLDHNNLVSLIEVLDDPQEDSLYMVLEMCKKGVAMKVGLDERAEPYDDETCRCWFRDMILGIEYLHAQGIIHRDIKPDNCLITEDDVLKIVDFGVSEMFEKSSEMATAKSAGSPAFMPPELCVARHGQVSGKAADIWSMGVTLFCLRYGHIPFEKGSMLELYESIRTEEVPVHDEKDANFADLISRILDKNPDTRITMEELRNHAWITKDGSDPLLSTDENCADIVDPPTEAEMDHAITGNMAHLLAVMSAVKRFKDLLHGKRGRPTNGIFGKDSQLVSPPQQINQQSRSQDTHDRRPMDKVLVTAGVHRDVSIDDDLEKLPQDFDNVAIQQEQDVELGTAVPSAERQPGETNARFKQRMETMRHHPSFSQEPSEHRKPFGSQRAQTFPLMEHGKGHAHDPLEDQFFLNIGNDPEVSHDDLNYHVVSESPPAVEMSIYEQAYKEEMDKIIRRRGRQPSAYLTRRVEHREDLRTLSTIKDAGKTAVRHAAATFDDVFTHGYIAGAGVREAGRNAARAAAGGFHDKFTPSQALGRDRNHADSWRELAKSAASSGLDTSKVAAKSATGAVSDLYNTYNKSTSAREGLSNVVAQAQAKAGMDEDPEIVASPTEIGDSFTSPFGRTNEHSASPSSEAVDQAKSALTSMLSRARTGDKGSK